MIQLICSDIDGTLLNKERQLSLKTIHEIKKIANLPFILISSRMPKAMVHLQQELNITHLPLIAYNGGLLIKNGVVQESTEINMQISKSIADFCKNTQIHLSLYHKDEWFVPAMDYWAKREQNNTKVTPKVKPVFETIKTWKVEKKGAHKIMCMGDAKEIDSLVFYIKNNCKGTIIGYRSKPTYLEISPKNISKKTAIKTLLKLNYPSIKMNNIMAFGDNYNDIEMLQSVGIGVAVENAKPEVLAISKHQTKSNLKNGVALFLNTHFN